MGSVGRRRRHPRAAGNGRPSSTDPGTAETACERDSLCPLRNYREVRMSRNRLQLVWPNKEKRLLTHGSDTYEWVDPEDWRSSEVRLLEPVNDVGDASAGNLVIHGDALHALTSLAQLPELRARYLGKVKLVYIDPPFNTGQAFTNYNDAVEHSVWLTMMRDRLRQIRSLLAEDGTVWVHLDDVEVHRMRCVLDEVFGSENGVASFLWRKVDSPNDNKVTVTPDHETLLVYGKRKNVASAFSRKPDLNLLNAYGGEDSEGRRYRDRLLKKNGKNSLREDRETMWFPITDPDGGEVWPIHDDGREACWSLGQKRVRELIAQDALIWKKRPDGDGGEKWVPYTREYASETPSRPWPTMWTDLPTTRQAKAHQRALHPGVREVFATPKPEQLLQRVIEMATKPGDIVLDCFAGSGTTAAVALKMQRRFITMEVEEETVENFLVPRLTQVVEGADPGGVTAGTTEVPAAPLPEGVDLEAVKAAVRTIGALSDEALLDEVLEPKARKQLLRRLRALSKSTMVDTGTGWDGGSGFRVLRVAESMFVADDDGDLYLAEWTHRTELDRAVCAQLRYTYEPAAPFVGRQGRSRLAVLDAMATEGAVRLLVDALGPGETLLVVAQAIGDGAEALLRDLRKGSKIRKMPNDLARAGVLPSQVVQLEGATDGDDS
ncbi:site-specific DNA-methyltransferase [Nocardioidaceae bacterium]|nr:site-specific DNA-methyltransferase [Nocardioidaceae bacterium]